MIRPRRAAAHLVALAAAASGYARRLERRRRARRDFRAFVLEYHDVTHGKEKEGTISAVRFRRHLAYLGRRYRVVTFGEAAERLADPAGLSEDLVALTFDDGYAGNAEVAWPELEAAGATATIFLTTGFLDGQGLWFDFARRAFAAALKNPGKAPALTEAWGAWPPGGVEGVMRRLKKLSPEARDVPLDLLREAPLELGPAAVPMSWDDARRLAAAGVELGGHTVTHPVLPTLDRARQEDEMRRSRERIAEEVGEAPATFSYPNGDHDAASLEAVRAAGYAAACTTKKGSNRPGADPYTLRRLGVGSDPIYLLAARLAGLFDEEMRQRLGR